MVGGVVLGNELQLSEMWVRREQAGPHLVHEVLYRPAVEFMERVLDLVPPRARAEKTHALRDPVAQIRVTPVRVEMDRERPIDELGEGRVIVAGECGERAPGGLHEGHALPAALRSGHPGLAGIDLERYPSDRAVASRRTEQDLARPALTGGRVELHLPGGIA